MILFNTGLIILGLIGLYFGGDALVDGASAIARKLGVPALIVGLTIVAIGTSAPELFVSVLAAFQDGAGIALGNVIGSNIANIGLILGATGAVSAIGVTDSLVRREIPILIFVTAFATLIILDGTVSRLDGIILAFGFVAFTYFFYELAKNSTAPPVEIATEDVDGDGDIDADDLDAIRIPFQLLRVVGGIVLLVIGAQSMVHGASEIAMSFGIDDLIIGLTIVAFGTSLPELAASLTAAMKGENDIAIGNVIGSNVANLLLVLGTTAAISPIDVGATDLSVVEFIVMLGFTFLLLPFVRNREISRIESALFLGGYFAFIAYSVMSVINGG